MSTIKRISMGLVAMAMVAMFTVAGIAEEKKAGKAINDKCPLSGKAVADDATLDVKVPFCCENCKGKFDKDPAKFIEKVAKAEEGKCAISGKDAGDASSTLTIGFCCNNCKGKAEKDVKATLAKVKAAKADK